MPFRNFVKSPFLFLYLGFLLVLLALACLAARVPVVVQPETPETELLHVADAIGLAYLTERAKLTETLRSPRVRTLVAIALASVPLVLAAGTLWLWTRYLAR